MQRTVADIQLQTSRAGSWTPSSPPLRPLSSTSIGRGFSILDAACASGYYSEVIAALDPRPIDYAGCDYSPAMIEMARAHYPDLPFSVQDLTALTLEDRSVDAVLLAGVLEHIPDYRAPSMRRRASVASTSSSTAARPRRPAGTSGRLARSTTSAPLAPSSRRRSSRQSSPRQVSARRVDRRVPKATHPGDSASVGRSPDGAAAPSRDADARLPSPPVATRFGRPIEGIRVSLCRRLQCDTGHRRSGRQALERGMSLHTFQSRTGTR